jgi:hypothetical protein
MEEGGKSFERETPLTDKALPGRQHTSELERGQQRWSECVGWGGVRTQAHKEDKRSCLGPSGNYTAKEKASMVL